ncbi:MAG: KOW domain-containing RNA-binding protein [Oscillospiraceae bacterium]|nr:KOW domain-containing RNA-binding protein [Oscillospiraceae bacterium]
MEIKRAHLVEATAGRERGKLFYVLDTDGDYLLLADGKSRRVEVPKRKKRKHARFISDTGDRVSVKIRENEKITNSELRKSIASYSGAENSDQEG